MDKNNNFILWCLVIFMACVIYTNKMPLSINITVNKTELNNSIYESTPEVNYKRDSLQPDYNVSPSESYSQQDM
jgi:hypothetical protein